MPPAFPKELCDVIIDYLHDDKEVLTKCSLVCTDWLPSTRFHLFSYVQLVSIDIDVALDVICAPQSTIPSHIRRLEIDNNFDSSTEFVNKVLAGLPPLGVLEHLTLVQVEWSSLSPDARAHLQSLSKIIKTLGLYNIDFGTFNQLLEFITSIPLLETLSLSSITCNPSNESVISVLPPPLKTLKIEIDEHEFSFLEWIFFDSQPVPSLHTLSLSGITLDRDDAKRISACICALGPALEHLEFSCGGFDTTLAQNALSEVLDLANNPSLRTIHFMDIFLFPGSKSSSWLRRILSKISSQVLQRVSCSLYMTTPNDLLSFDLPAIGEMFADKKRTKLHLAVYGGVDVDEARVAIRLALRDLDIKGQLEFGVTPNPF
ncbi:hypothetical protein BDZ97DRAFT_1919105 [Flammula alnicola]|nr:hypothetical protein BDZ97DRAFT_1919105 [Flammula alnicola]